MYGYWQGEIEITFILQIAHPNPELILENGHQYRLTFFQESVMLILPSGFVEFLDG
jgi:hypothetical protein